MLCIALAPMPFLINHYFVVHRQQEVVQRFNQKKGIHASIPAALHGCSLEWQLDKQQVGRVSAHLSGQGDEAGTAR